MTTSGFACRCSDENTSCSDYIQFKTLPTSETRIIACSETNMILCVTIRARLARYTQLTGHQVVGPAPTKQRCLLPRPLPRIIQSPLSAPRPRDFLTRIRRPPISSHLCINQRRRHGAAALGITDARHVARLGVALTPLRTPTP